MHSLLASSNLLILPPEIERHRAHAADTQNRERQRRKHTSRVIWALTRLERNRGDDTTNTTTNHARRGRQRTLGMRDDVVGLVRQHAWNAVLQEADTEVSAEVARVVVLGEGSDEHPGCGQSLVDTNNRATDLVLVCCPGGNVSHDSGEDVRWCSEELGLSGGVSESTFENDGEEVGVCVAWQSGGHEHDSPSVELRVLEMMKHDL